MKTTLALILTLALWGCAADEVSTEPAPDAAKVEAHEGHEHAHEGHEDAAHEGHDHAAHADHHEGHDHVDGDHAKHGEEGCAGHEDGTPCDCEKGEGHEGDHADCPHHKADEGAEPAAEEAEGTEAVE